MTPAIDPGALAARLDLLEAPDQPDGTGGFIGPWTVVARLWAQIRPLGSRAELRGEVRTGTVTHEVLIRSHPALRPGMRLARGKRRLEIEAIHDPDETGRFALCRVRELT